MFYILKLFSISNYTDIKIIPPFMFPYEEHFSYGFFILTINQKIKNLKKCFSKVSTKKTANALL